MTKEKHRINKYGNLKSKSDFSAPVLRQLSRSLFCTLLESDVSDVRTEVIASSSSCQALSYLVTRSVALPSCKVS